MHSTIARCAMQSVWNCTPNSFQAEVIPLILQIITNDKVPGLIFLAQQTGSGKSSAPQVASVVSSGVTIIIECAQSLGSDQALKIKQVFTKIGSLVCACQLDTHKTNKDRNALASNMLSIMKEKNISPSTKE